MLQSTFLKAALKKMISGQSSHLLTHTGSHMHLPDTLYSDTATHAWLDWETPLSWRSKNTADVRSVMWHMWVIATQVRKLSNATLLRTLRAVLELQRDSSTLSQPPPPPPLPLPAREVFVSECKELFTSFSCCNHVEFTWGLHRNMADVFVGMSFVFKC